LNVARRVLATTAVVGTASMSSPLLPGTWRSSNSVAGGMSGASPRLLEGPAAGSDDHGGDRNRTHDDIRRQTGHSARSSSAKALMFVADVAGAVRGIDVEPQLAAQPVNEVDRSLVALGLTLLHLFVVFAQEAIQVVRPRDVLEFRR
jgi:hypothetical protein